MNHSPRKYEEMAYIIGGMICLALAAMGSLFSAFASIGFALKYFGLVDVPLVIGMLGTATRVKLFPLLVMFGCGATVIYIVSLYTHDAIYYPNSKTAFIHERSGWIYGVINMTEMALASRRIFQVGSIPVKGVDAL